MNKSFVLFALLYIGLKCSAQIFKTEVCKGDTLYVLPSKYNYWKFDGYNKDTIPDGKWMQIDYRNSRYYFTIKNNLLDGVVIEIDSNGIILSDCQHYKGTRNGPCKTYYSNGKLRTTIYWKNGSQSDQYYFYENGNLKKRFVEIDFGSDSTGRQITYWYENGLVDSSGFYMDGSWKGITRMATREGIWYKYYQDGRIKSYELFRGGVLNGSSSYWVYFEKTYILREEKYENGKFINSYEYERKY